MFYDQFKKFDPIAGYVPEHPFSYLPEIAERARSILRMKAPAHLDAIAKKIDQEFEWRFESIKYGAVKDLEAKLQADGVPMDKYFVWKVENETKGEWQFRDDMLEDLEIQTADNCNEVELLKAIIEDRDWLWVVPEGAPEPKRNEYEEGKTDELFAVLALWMLADTLAWARNKSSTAISLAGEYALKAMDAVCYAEKLREIDWVEGYSKRKGDKELAMALAEQRQEIQEKIRREKRDRSKELNTHRHAKTYKAKDMVLAEWAKSPSKFPSAEKAGLHFADWLESQGVVTSIQPRTVTDWIRTYAKQNEIKLR